LPNSWLIVNFWILQELQGKRGYDLLVMARAFLSYISFKEF